MDNGHREMRIHLFGTLFSVYSTLSPFSFSENEFRATYSYTQRLTIENVHFHFIAVVNLIECCVHNAAK